MLHKDRNFILLAQQIEYNCVTIKETSSKCSIQKPYIIIAGLDFLQFWALPLWLSYDLKEGIVFQVQSLTVSSHNKAIQCNSFISLNRICRVLFICGVTKRNYLNLTNLLALLIQELQAEYHFVLIMGFITMGSIYHS